MMLPGAWARQRLFDSTTEGTEGHGRGAGFQAQGQSTFFRVFRVFRGFDGACGAG